MPAVYLPVLVMLPALIFPGVAFEFRWRVRSDRSRAVRDMSFFAGSALAALAQGVILGALLKGVAVEGRAYAGGTWDWLGPFSLLTGVAGISGYALLGACWLNIKTMGARSGPARLMVRLALAGTPGFIGAVSLVTPFLEAAYYERRFAWPGFAFSAVVSLAMPGFAAPIPRALSREGRDPFCCHSGRPGCMGFSRRSFRTMTGFYRAWGTPGTLFSWSPACRFCRGSALSCFAWLSRVVEDPGHVFLHPGRDSDVFRKAPGLAS